ncbi:hypothetical protein M758_4G156300 [Ceratodon purpureus]|nr:hypothetical protein M758_4G156300 [Ceratodon purpureus]
MTHHASVDQNLECVNSGRHAVLQLSSFFVLSPQPSVSPGFNVLYLSVDLYHEVELLRFVLSLIIFLTFNFMYLFGGQLRPVAFSRLLMSSGNHVRSWYI